MSTGPRSTPGSSTSTSRHTSQQAKRRALLIAPEEKTADTVAADLTTPGFQVEIRTEPDCLAAEAFDLILLQGGKQASMLASQLVDRTTVSIIWRSDEAANLVEKTGALGTLDINSPTSEEFAAQLISLLLADRSKLAAELRHASEDLETRKLVEQAKGVLIDQFGLNDSEAYRRLQREDTNTRKPPREIARAILMWEYLGLERHAD